MLSGLIVYSKLDSTKNTWFIDKCIKELSNRGIALVYVEENGVLEYVKTHQVDFVINRARNYEIVEMLESHKIPCFNNSLTNKIANNKYLSYEFFKEHNLPCLKSNLLNNKLLFPYVMKSVDGHGGEEVFLINSPEDLSRYQKPNKQYIYQGYCPHSGDLRLYVLNKKVVGAVIRHNEKDFRSNYSLAGEISSYQPNKEIIDIALKIVEILNADYVGIDFLCADGKWYLNEIEDPVGARMLYQTSKIDVIELFCEFIANKLTANKL